ncbi:MAG TPA: radical SAM protein [Myxococcales bacterium]|nr:radical SAM protein [Myxococcales bacterium]
MKIAFINPRFPDSLWGFQGISDLVGARSGQAPLGLVTVAALTPPEIEVELLDENCHPLRFDDLTADVAAIGCWSVQYGRAVEIARELKRRGKLVVAGGPYPTLSPEHFDGGPFDVVFEGEAELTWPEFCRDLAAGAPRPRYRQPGNIDVRHSPVPRFDLLRQGEYLYYYVQTTRGCPFRCEFCDIIVTDGRVPRTKSVQQVIAEIETIVGLGGRYVTFSDANFIGNVKYAEELLRALVEFGRARGFPVTFSAEMTVTVAEKPQLLGLLREANFTSIFVGIESPRAESLVETRKPQNLRRSLLECIRRIQSHNIMVIAGMIVGFDHDDTRIFQEQFDFLMEAGVAFTTCGILTAIDKTPLYARLAREGRLLPYDSADVHGHGAADLNFIPAGMTRDELLQGYNWLIRALYKYESYGARLATTLRSFAAGSPPPRAGLWSRERLLIALKVLLHFALGRDPARRRFFFRTLADALHGRPSWEKVVCAVSYMIAHKHFHEFVTQTHGDPEVVGDVSPFANVVKIDRPLHREVVAS